MKNGTQLSRPTQLQIARLRRRLAAVLAREAHRAQDRPLTNIFNRERAREGR